MCLGVPLKIVQKIDENNALVDIGGSKMEVCIALTPEAKEGDFIIVHAGFSISILSEEEANYIINLTQTSNYN